LEREKVDALRFEQLQQELQLEKLT